MKKFSITAFAAFIGLLLAAGAASAAEITSVVAGVGQDEARTVYVTVNYTNPEDAQESTLLVVNENVSILLAESGEIRYIDQKDVVGSAVKYSFKMAAADRKGTYDVYIGGTKVDAPASTTICFDYTAATTIKFVDKSDTSRALATEVVVNCNVGDKITVSDYAPDVLEYGGRIYKKDDTNSASFTAESAVNELTVTYSADAITAIEGVSATVIEGNTPVLPTKLTATTEGGTSTTATVTEWDFSNLKQGENTVYGTVYASNKKAQAQITVLPESFSLEDAASKGNAENSIYFPSSLAGEFYIEFDMVINTVSDTGANFGCNGTRWGGGAFGISPNGGVLKVTGGNKSGTSDGGTVLKDSVSAGETYRILVKADAQTDTFSVYATGSDGKVGKAENKTFRQEQSPDCINTINLRGNNAADGDVEIKNVKVYSTSYVKAKFANKNGEVVKEAAGEAGFTVEKKEIFAIHRDGTAAFYTIPETVVNTHTTITIDEVDNKYAVKGDTFVNNGTNDSSGLPLDNAERGIRLVAAAANGAEGTYRAPGTNADSEQISSGGAVFGSARAAVLEFDISEAMRGSAVMMKVYVDAYKSNADGTTVCYPAAYTIENPSDTEGLTALYSDSAVAPTSDPIFALDAITVNANGEIAIDGYVSFDVSEAVHSALDSGKSSVTFKIMVPVGGAYLADRNACTEGGVQEGNAAYLYLADAKAVTVTGAKKLTKKGTNVKIASDGTAEAMLTANSYLTMTADTTDGIIAFADGANNLYALDDSGTLKIEGSSVTENKALSAKAFNLLMYSGAQVRYGSGVDENGKITQSTAGLSSSGLRFIAQAAAESPIGITDVPGVDYGIAIKTADDSSTVYVKAEAFQDDAKRVFTAALVNLKEGNYNRKFIATPYVRLSENKVILGTDIDANNKSERSIYQVSAGLLAKQTADDNSGLGYTVTSAIEEVLNAYVNQVGIRLSLTSAGIQRADSAYTGDIFFTVAAAENADGSYTVTITPENWHGLSIADWWRDYVRINNNNSKVRNMITVDEATGGIDGDGNLTFTFNPNTVTSAQ